MATLLDQQRRVLLAALPEDVRSSPAVQAMATLNLLHLFLSAEYTGTLLEMKAKWAADNGWPLTMVEYGLLTIPPHDEEEPEEPEEE